MRSTCIQLVRIFLAIVLLHYCCCDEEELSYARIGMFDVYWDVEEPFLVITSHEGRVLFRTLQHWPFLTAGYASSSQHPIGRTHS
jgi:hypothetical protein